MKVQYLFSIFLFILMICSPAIAKDNQLKQEMIDLEQTYIPALFFTGKPADDVTPEAQLLGISKAKLSIYKVSWAAFSDKYKTYRSSWRNWISYFESVQGLIDEADGLLEDGNRLDSHEVLEEIRTTMADFRGRNGFPKFITDQFTDFHTIMGEIISIATKEFDENTIEILFELYKEASRAWSKVEKNVVNPDAWDLSPEDVGFYYNLIQAERVALDNFELALSYGDPAGITATAKGLKSPQAQAYLTLGGVINN